MSCNLPYLNKLELSKKSKKLNFPFVLRIGKTEINSPNDLRKSIFSFLYRHNSAVSSILKFIFPS